MTTFKTTAGGYTATLTSGNKKLVSNNYVKYLIFSIPAVKTCPYATEHCKSACYALKAERCYKSAKNSRESNYNATLSADFAPAMASLIRATVARKSYASAKKIVVRIHESGDFYSQDYFNSWLEIATACADLSRVVFVAYTKSLPYVHDIPANMVIRSSIWDDTAPDMVSMTQALNLPIYTAVDSFTTEPATARCECINCSTCFKCFSAKFELLKCEIH